MKWLLCMMAGACADKTSIAAFARKRVENRVAGNVTASCRNLRQKRRLTGRHCLLMVAAMTAQTRFWHYYFTTTHTGGALVIV
jgi:hypothetical protein